MRTALVVDSGCQAPAELVERLRLSVVPLTVVVDGVPLLEGAGIDAEGITAALARGATVTTSSPSPGELLQAYARAEQAGFDAVVSVHTGGAVSATLQAARLAAAQAPLPVELVDTGSASFPVTLCAWAAADALAAGADPASAAAAARAVAGTVGNVFVVGALAVARRGGRLAGDVVDPAQVPVLALAAGAMRQVAQVQDRAGAVDAMTAYVRTQAGTARLRVGVGQLGAPELADELEQSLRGSVEVAELVRYVVGPSIAAHTGVGTVGCVFTGV